MVPFFMSDKITKDKTYLFNNVEVKLTGRCTFTTRMKRTQEVKVMIYEVQPVDEFEGSWKKWAKTDELLEIQNMENE